MAEADAIAQCAGALCVQCGKPIAVEQTRRGPRRKVCSLLCRARRTQQGKRALRPDRPRRQYRRRTVRQVSCIACGTSFETKDPVRRCCSARCGARLGKKRQSVLRAEKAAARLARKCERCGKDFKMHRPSGKANAGRVNEGRFCSRFCAHGGVAYASRKDAKRARKHRRRAREKAVEAERFSNVEIFQRDGWRCGLCGDRVNRKLRHPNEMCASLDHIVPLMEGGAHTKANVQLAHLRCNVAKGVRAGGQLRLFG